MQQAQSAEEERQSANGDAWKTTAPSRTATPPMTTLPYVDFLDQRFFTRINFIRKMRTSDGGAAF